MLEPVTIATHAVDLGNIVPGKTVAISGAGTIGLLVQQIAMRAGAARVFVSDPMPEKREMAKRFGADWTVDPLTEDMVAVGRELMEGRGFDTVFECSGHLSAVPQTINLADKYGTIVWAGAYHEDADLPAQPLLHVRQRAHHPLHHVGPVRLPPRAQAPLQAGPRADDHPDRPAGGHR